MIRKIRQAGVIGSGVMGGGIAALLASAGIKTWLFDIVPGDLKPEEKDDPLARNRIVKAGLDGAIMAQPPLFMSLKDAERIRIANLEDDFDKLSRCDWIVEVVVENLDVKKALFKRIEGVRKKGAVVSSNTSGLPLQEMSQGLSADFKQHFLGTHFFNPVRYMKLLEIIPGEDTLPEVLDFMAAFGERRLGKGIVWAKDTPNFVGNRIGVQGMVKAMQLMPAHGLSITDVDAIFGLPMGRPKTAMFKTSDLVGLDTMKHVADNTYELVKDDSDRDDFVIPDFLNRMVEKGMLGKKSGKGFYKTDLTPEWKKIRMVIDPKTLEYTEWEPADFPCLQAAKKAKTLPERIKTIAYGDDKGAVYAWEVIAHNLLYAAKRIPEISDTICEIDNAMKWGFNFEMGPFETWDALGLAESVERMEKEGMLVPDNIKQMLAAGHTAFYKTEKGTRYYYDFAAGAYQKEQFSDNIIFLKGLKATGKTAKSTAGADLVDLGDGVFCCEFKTKMNTLNTDVLVFLDESIDYVDKNGVGLVIGNQAGGMPGAFSAGADLSHMVTAIKEARFSEVEAVIRQMQGCMQRMKYAPLPVVAAPYGMTLAGGCEVCLAADRMVAHADLYMGLVEIGVGLIPAGGGCLNLWKRFVNSTPEAAGDVDLAKFFLPTFMTIAMAKVSMSAAEARANGFLLPTDRIVFNRDYLISEAKKEILKMVDEGYAPPVKQKVKVLGQAAMGMVNSEIYNMREGKFISDYDAFLAKRVAFVISGGEVRENSLVDEDVILTLERETFVDLLKQDKTLARIEHLLKTGKPLRN